MNFACWYANLNGIPNLWKNRVNFTIEQNEALWRLDFWTVFS